jgi:hypothetical protein
VMHAPRRHIYFMYVNSKFIEFTYEAVNTLRTRAEP